jgi:lysyl-tRNA synthetase class 2
LSLEDNLFDQRVQRIREIEALGFQAYGHRFDFTHTVPAILASESAKTAEELEALKPRVIIAGRIQTVRRMGKAGFLHLTQQGERLQIYVRKDAVSERDYKLYEILDIGDIIGVEGYLFRTRTGELSLHAERLTFLSKILLSTPEKWHGLEDVEIRYRQRYLDLIANPDSHRIFRTRAKIISSLRRQLEERGFVEVETPMMQPLYGGAAARPFVTHHNTLDMDLYLRIAPELYLKRLTVGGFDRVYEINRNFRNEGISTQHNPEFTMLEFYEAYSNYRDLMDLNENLFALLAKNISGSTTIKYGEHELDFAKFERLSMREAIIKYWPADLQPAPTLQELSSADGPPTIGQRYNAWAKSTGAPYAAVKGNLPAGEWTGLLFETIAEGKLIQPTILYDFPIDISPLSKQKLDDPSLVERFEIYVAGMEIANGFSELNDPAEQERRFLAQIAEGGEESPKRLDVDYIQALCYGLPPTAGEGIGIDRLTMLLTDSKSIRDVILFPLLRPEPLSRPELSESQSQKPAANPSEKA